MNLIEHANIDNTHNDNDNGNLPFMNFLLLSKFNYQMGSFNKNGSSQASSPPAPPYLGFPEDAPWPAPPPELGPRPPERRWEGHAAP